MARVERRRRNVYARNDDDYFTDFSPRSERKVVGGMSEWVRKQLYGNASSLLLLNLIFSDVLRHAKNIYSLQNPQQSHKHTSPRQGMKNIIFFSHKLKIAWQKLTLALYNNYYYYWINKCRQQLLWENFSK